MLVTKNPRIKKSCFCRDLLHQRQSYHDSLVIWLPSINHFFLHITTYISHHWHHCWNPPLVFVMQDLLVHYCYHSSWTVIIVIFEVLIFWRFILILNAIVGDDIDYKPLVSECSHSLLKWERSHVSISDHNVTLINYSTFFKHYILLQN